MAEKPEETAGTNVRQTLSVGKIRTEESGTLGQTRTADPQFRKLLLYPLSYKGMGLNLVLLEKVTTPQFYFLPNIRSSWSSENFTITGLP
jgi:hypothetical protein